MSRLPGQDYHYFHSFFLCLGQKHTRIHSLFLLLHQFSCKFYLCFQSTGDSQTVYHTVFEFIYHCKCLYPFICLYFRQSYFGYFMSMLIANWLLGHKITVTSAMHTDKKGIPPETKMVSGKGPNLQKCCYNEKKMLISWTDKKIKQKDPKLVFLVSTMHDQMKVSKGQCTKPHTIFYYLHMKGGLSIADFISAVASTCIKSE